MFYEAQIIKFQSSRRERADQIRILLQLGANSVTDTFKIYSCTRGSVIRDAGQSESPFSWDRSETADSCWSARRPGKVT